MALNEQMLFRRGDMVEVASQKQGFRGSYFVATVVMVLTPVREYVVEYETLVTNDLSGPLREVVPAAEVRPVPPPEFRMRDSGEFRKGDKVDAYDNEAWWAGEIIGKVGDKYKVYFDDSNEEIAYTVDLLRVHLDWIHLRAKGNLVEVASVQEGFRGSYFAAIVASEGAAAGEKVHRGVRDAGDGEFVGAALRGRRRRGSPAEAAESEEERRGRLRSRRFGGCYAVYFACSEEEIEYRDESLRIHLEWVDIRAEWVDPMRRGDLVEVASVQEGFRGSYFEAIVVATVLPAANKYIVEYETLVTEDLSAPLCEIVAAAEVRPRPPRVRRRDGGDFEVGDLVDAYDNEGWWAGEITGKVGDKFSVYFACSEEEIEYRVESLRIHLDWVQIRAEWVDPMRRSLVFF
nr:DUF724 domain-containing protein 2-like [Ipomoea batatas]